MEILTINKIPQKMTYLVPQENIQKLFIYFQEVTNIDV